MTRLTRLVLVLSVPLSACASGVGVSKAEPGTEAPAVALASDPRLGDPVDTVCFSGGVSGFREMGDRALLIRQSPSTSYLVRTGHCPNLDVIEGLKLEGHDQCLSRGQGLLVFDTPVPRRGSDLDKPDRCLVLSMHDWTEQP